MSQKNHDGKNAFQDVEIARLEERLVASNQARDLAYNELQKRLEGMNEFREQLKDQAATFISRAELEAKLEGIEKGRRDNLAVVVGFISIIISILLRVLP
jgi:hypothetical protein